MEKSDFFDIDVQKIISIVQSVMEKVSRNASPVRPSCAMMSKESSHWVRTHLFGSCGLNAATADSDVDLYA